MSFARRVGSAAARLAPALTHGRIVALVILAVVVAARAADPTAMQLLLMRSFDVLQELFPREAQEQPVVIVDIDDESLAELGQWPWPRTLVAALVDRLTELDAAVIGFDVLFAEPDRTSPGEIARRPGLDAETRTALAALPSNDSVLAASFARSRVVLAAAAKERALGTPGEDLGVRAPLARLGGDPLPWLRRLPGLVRPLPQLEAAAQGRGMVTIEPERDGIVRRVPLLFNIEGQLFPALVFDMLRVLTGQSVAVRTDAAGIVEVMVADNAIPTDQTGRVWVHFARRETDIYVSVRDLLAGKVDPARIAGKLVLVGTSATGLVDNKATPLDPALPGVEVHAQLLETILGGSYLIRPNWADGAELCLLALTGILTIVLVSTTGARWTLLVLLLIDGVIVLGTGYLYVRQAFLLDGALPLMTTAVLYTILVYDNYSREEKQRRQIRSAFSQYLSPVLVEQLAADPSRLRLGGEFRDMTFMFSDIRGFTAISERYRGAAASLTRLINRFMTAMTAIIHERRGTIDKYIGDCIMALWNAPLDDAEHARNACRAALEMLQALERLNADLAVEAAEGEASQRLDAASGGTQTRRRVFTARLDIGIGINSGGCVVGNMGSEQRLAYTVLGDSVNLAARLESQAKTYGVVIVIGESTAQAVPDFALIELDLVAVKGRAEAVHIFTLLGDDSVAVTPEYQALRARHDALMAAYRARDWAAARGRIAECRPKDSRLAPLYDLYEARIAAFEQDPPPEGWTGVYVAESK